LLLYAVCVVLRLARVQRIAGRRDPSPAYTHEFFVGDARPGRAAVSMIGLIGLKLQFSPKGGWWTSTWFLCLWVTGNVDPDGQQDPDGARCTRWRWPPSWAATAGWRCWRSARRQRYWRPYVFDLGDHHRLPVPRPRTRSATSAGSPRTPEVWDEKTGATARGCGAPTRRAPAKSPAD